MGEGIGGSALRVYLSVDGAEWGGRVLPGGALEWIVPVRAGSRIEATRASLDIFKQYCPHDPREACHPPHYAYQLEPVGLAGVRAEGVVPLRVRAPGATAGDTALVTEAQEATFTLEAVDGITQPQWYFLAWEGSVRLLRDCFGQMSCTVIPPKRGSVIVYGKWNGYTFGSEYLHIASGQHENVAEQQPVLNLVCTPSVPRGGDVRCTATVTPAMEMVVTQRTARGAGFAFTEERADPVAAGDSVTWTGKGVAPTQVRLTARVMVAGQAKVLRATANFAVTARTWSPYQLVAPSTFTVGLRGDMTGYPTNGHLGNFGLNGLNPFSTPIDSVSSGLNSGLMYFMHRPPFIGSGSSIYIHPGLYPATGGGTPGHSEAQRWYNDQNGTPRGTCSQSDIPLLRTEVERHEGVTQAYDSHYGVANRQFLARRPERALEALYLFRVPQARLQMRAYRIYERFVTGPAHAAQDAFDNVDRPLVLAKFSCQFDFTRSNP
jgi:hypothetical protein